MTRAYLALGSNLGDRAATLQRAVDALGATPGLRVVAVSKVYETEPIGPPQPDYLNAVVALDTDLGARALLEVGQELEREARRTRGERFGPRTLDVDVLLVGDDRVDEPDLIVPHPRMWERHFVLAPLADVAENLVEQPTQGWAGVRPSQVRLRVDADQ
jgi:2-amino-4-hydroxy-6-hydroxymethyldihydropteridine diphosphokinase